MRRIKKIISCMVSVLVLTDCGLIYSGPRALAPRSRILEVAGSANKSARESLGSVGQSIRLSDGLCVHVPNCGITNENGGFRLNKDGKKLTVRQTNYNNRLFLQIGSRIYETKTGGSAEIDLSEMMYDPLLWIGNAELVDFFGKNSVLHNERPRGPPQLLLVEWNEDLRGKIPEPEVCDGKIIEHAREYLSSPNLAPLLRTHYSLVVYFFDSPRYGDAMPVSVFEVMSHISEQRTNELLLRLLGIKDVIIPHNVSPQLWSFYKILRRLCITFEAKYLQSVPAGPGDIEAQNRVISKLNPILAQITHKDIKDFMTIEKVNKKFNELAKGEINLFRYDPTKKTLVIVLDELAKKQDNDTDARSLYIYKNGTQDKIDRDVIVVEALASLCRRGVCSTVNAVCGAIPRWEQDWAVNTVLQGVAANHGISLAEGNDVFFSELKIGVGRSGFGLGGASIETETWCRDVFSDIVGTIKILAGVFKDGSPYVFEQVFFGNKVNKERDCAGLPLIDSYNYRDLCQLLFTDDPITFDALKGLLQAASMTSNEEESPERALQRIYDHYVERTKEALKKWILDNDLKILLFGQMTLPNENPIFIPALLMVMEEINKDRPPEKRVAAFLRHNYFRKKWKVRNGINIRIIRKEDPVEVFVESEVNAQIFEDYFGFRPTVLYEAAHFPKVNTRTTTSFREQIREGEDLSGAVDSFRNRLELACANKEPVDLERDIIIVHPSRVDSNKRPDSTIILAKNLQRMENERNPPSPRKVRVIFLGSTERKGPTGTAGLSGDEAKTFNLIKRLAEDGDINIREQVYFLGYVPQKEVIAALTFAHVMTQASDRETFGRTPIEAIATGVPIVYCRDWTYPFDPLNRQVYHQLFGGFRTFTLRPGEINGEDGTWISGEIAPKEEDGQVPRMHRFIWHLLQEPDSMESIARLNFFLCRRSMLNLKNLENFMRLRFLAYYDRDGSKLKFEDISEQKDIRKEDRKSIPSPDSVSTGVLLESV